MASKVIFLVLCCAFTVVLCKKPCVYVEYGENALSSSHSAVIYGVNLLESCMEVLNKHRHHAVAFNHVTNECCGVPANLTYTLISDSDWTAYTLNTGSDSGTIAKTTAAATHKSTTAETKTSVDFETVTDNDWSTESSAEFDPASAVVSTVVTTDHNIIDFTTAHSHDEYETSTETAYYDTTYSYLTDMKHEILVGNTRVALFCGESGKFVQYTWSEAVSRCRSMGWWPAQLSTEKLFFALNNFTHAESKCLMSWVGARANDTSAAHVWTKSNTPVQTNFWAKSKPPSVRDYPFVNAHITVNGPVLYGAYSGLTLPSFICTLENN